MDTLKPLRTEKRLLKARRQLRSILGFYLPIGVIGFFIALAFLGGVIAPHDPVDMQLRNRNMPPFLMSGGSLDYPLGTDHLGRDILSRIIVGAKVSLSVGALSIGFATVIGASLGLIAGYFEGWLGSLIMRVTDSMFAFPMIIFALILAVVVGPSYSNIIIVITLVLWARFARMARAETLKWKVHDFVALAHVAGCSHFRIMLRHLLPNLLNTIVVLSTAQAGWAILTEASLSFLGVGIPPPDPAWGSMVAAGRNYLTTAWWSALFPGLAILLVVISLNLFGDWLRDALDPKLRQV